MNHSDVDQRFAGIGAPFVVFGKTSPTGDPAEYVFDDHSRYVLELAACSSPDRETVQQRLIPLFRHDGMPHAQMRFDPFRDMYNHERPHEALVMAVTASRYRASDRTYPEQLPPFEYRDRFDVRRTNRVGQFRFQSRVIKASEAFANDRLGLTPTAIDGVWDLCHSHHRIGQIDLREPTPKSAGLTTWIRDFICVTHVSGLYTKAHPTFKAEIHHDSPLA